MNGDNDAFWRRLNERLDARRPLSDEPSLADEASGDRRDQALLQAAEALRVGAAQLSRPAPRAELEDQVFAALAAGGSAFDDDAPAPSADPRRARRLALGFVAVLSAAAALALASFFTPQREMAVKPPAAAAATGLAANTVGPTAADDPAAPLASGDRPVPLHVLIAQAQQRYAALATETQSSFDDVALLWPDLTTNDMAQASPPEGAAGWLDGVKSELPTPAPLNDAFKRLWDAATAGDDQTS